MKLLSLLKKQKKQQPSQDQEEITAEELEARVLYSAAPVEAPAPVEEAAPAVEAEQADLETIEAFVEDSPSDIPADDNPSDVGVVNLTSLENLTETEAAALKDASVIDKDEAVTLEAVETLAKEAAQRWIESGGLSAEQVAALGNIEYRVADLGPNRVGLVEGNVITIDINGAEKGWFVDQTPDQDEEFAANDQSELHAVLRSAQENIDLLTVLMHEQGHVLGLNDSTIANNVMHYFRAEGQRHNPNDGQAEGAVAGSVSTSYNSVYHDLEAGGFSEDWSVDNISQDDDWNGVTSIIGYSGEGMPNTVTGQNPQQTLDDGSSTPVQVYNGSDATSTAGGVHEVSGMIALQPDDTAIAPHIVLHLDTSNRSDITISYDLVELNANNSVQGVALQYRLGASGNFIDVPNSYVADASNGSGLVTSVSATLPFRANDYGQVQVRIITVNTGSPSSMIGIDNLQVTSQFDTTAAINIEFDYRFAGSFFTDQVRDRLEAAGQILAQRMTDNLLAIEPGGGNTWTADFFNPAVSGSSRTQITDLVVPEKTIIIFVGSPNLDGQGGTLAEAAPGFTANVSGDTTWQDTVEGRGQAGALFPDDFKNDFGLWGGMIRFDSSENWSFSEGAPPAGQHDFFSTAAHEIGHVLGINSFTPSWLNTIDDNGQAAGQMTRFHNVANPGSPVDLQAGGAHWAAGTIGRLRDTNTTQDTMMDPFASAGERVLPTELDFAGFDDLGWDVEYSFTGRATYTDTAGITQVSEAGQTDTLEITLSHVPNQDVIVTFQPVDNNLDLGNGAGNSVSLTFTAASNINDPKLISIAAIDDLIPEGDHTAQIRMTVVSGDIAFVQAPTIINVQIVDNDGEPPVFSLDPPYSVTEGNGDVTSPFTITARRDNPIGAATVDFFFTAGTANANDFGGLFPAPGQFVFSNGQSTATATIDIFGDTFFEPDETFTITLENPSIGTVDPLFGTAVYSITNDDPPADPAVLLESFDDDSGFTKNASFFTDGDNDYFGIFNDDNIGGSAGHDFDGHPIERKPDLHGAQGSYLAGEDLDAANLQSNILVPRPGTRVVTWTDLPVGGLAGLSFSADIAAKRGAFDEDDHITFEVKLDDGPFVELMSFTYDGLGLSYNGTELTYAFQTVTEAISGTGSLLDLRVTIKADGANEEFGIDNVRVDGTSPLQVQGEADGVVGSVSYGDVATIAQAAIERWKQSGLSETQIEALENINYAIADLEGDRVGGTTGFTVTIDPNAAGRGWFIDGTPLADEEFVQLSPTLYATNTGEASEGIDLLTTIMHEQGHVLGLLDETDLAEDQNLMYAFIQEGERRIAAQEQADGLDSPSGATAASEIQAGLHPSLANPRPGRNAWGSTPQVNPENGEVDPYEGGYDDGFTDETVYEEEPPIDDGTIDDPVPTTDESTYDGSMPEGFNEETPEGYDDGTEPDVFDDSGEPGGYDGETEPGVYEPEGYDDGTEPGIYEPEGYDDGTEPTGGTSEPTDEPTEPTDEPTEPTGGPTEPTGGPTEPTGGPTEPTGGPTEPTGGPTEPTGGPTEPTGGTSEPTGGTSEPTGGTSEPTGGTSEPTGEPTEPTDEPTEPTGGTSEPTPDSPPGDEVPTSEEPDDFAGEGVLNPGPEEEPPSVEPTEDNVTVTTRSTPPPQQPAPQPEPAQPRSQQPAAAPPSQPSSPEAPAPTGTPSSDSGGVVPVNFNNIIDLIRGDSHHRFFGGFQMGSHDGWSPFFAGISSPSASIRIVLRDEVGIEIGTADTVADTSGNWSALLNGDFEGSLSEVQVEMSEAKTSWSGNSGESSRFIARLTDKPSIPEGVGEGQIFGEVLSGSPVDGGF